MRLGLSTLVHPGPLGANRKTSTFWTLTEIFRRFFFLADFFLRYIREGVRNEVAVLQSSAGADCGGFGVFELVPVWGTAWQLLRRWKFVNLWEGRSGLLGRIPPASGVVSVPNWNGSHDSSRCESSCFNAPWGDANRLLRLHECM